MCRQKKVKNDKDGKYNKFTYVMSASENNLLVKLIENHWSGNHLLSGRGIYAPFYRSLSKQKAGEVIFCFEKTQTGNIVRVFVDDCCIDTFVVDSSLCQRFVDYIGSRGHIMN